MKLYLASQFSRQGELIAYSNILHANGFRVTSRWLMEEGDDNDQSNYSLYARTDREDIDGCDAFLLFCGPPYSGDLAAIARGGRHYETGYADAKGKIIFIIGERENIFHHLPHIHHSTTFKEALNDLIRLRDYHLMATV